MSFVAAFTVGVGLFWLALPYIEIAKAVGRRARLFFNEEIY